MAPIIKSYYTRELSKRIIFKLFHLNAKTWP